MRVTSVAPDYRGATVSVDALAGATVLDVDTTIDLNDDGNGGLLVIADDTTPLTYTDVDEDALTVTLAAPLAADVPADTGLRVWDAEAGATVVEYTAGVIDDDGYTFTAILPHALIPLSGLGSLVGASVTVDDDLRIVEIVGRAPVVDGGFIDPATLPIPDPSDGLPPDFSPVPTLTAGIGSLFVKWPPVDNADPVTYRVYASATSPVTVDPAALAATTPGEFAVLRTLPDGSPLPYDADTFVAIVAGDMDEDAAISASVAGRPIQITDVDVDTLDGSKITPLTITTDQIAANAIEAGQIAANAVTAGTIAANAVTAGTIAADAIDGRVITGSTLRTAASGRRIVIADALDEFGNQIDFYDPAGVTAASLYEQSGGLLISAAALIASSTGAATVQSATAAASLLSIGTSGEAIIRAGSGGGPTQYPAQVRALASDSTVRAGVTPNIFGATRQELVVASTQAAIGGAQGVSLSAKDSTGAAIPLSVQSTPGHGLLSRWKNADQSMPDATYTAITWPDDISTDASTYTVSGGSITFVRAGSYLVNFSAEFAANAATGSRFIRPSLNGTAIKRLLTPDAGGVGVQVAGSFIVAAAAGDVLQIPAFLDTTGANFTISGNANKGTSVSIMRLGE